MINLYVNDDSYIAELIWDNDFDGFCDTICEDHTSWENLDWRVYEVSTTSEANGFITGLIRNEDERSPARYAVLRSDNPEHERYIEFLKEYI